MAWDRQSVASAMITRMSDDELKLLAFSLNVDDENLSHDTKTNFVISLVKYMEQRETLDLLVDELAQMRPDIMPPAPAPEPQRTPRIEVVSPPPPLTPAEPKLGDRMTDATGIRMVYVPSGTFTMGSADISDDERPPHKVVITRGFWLDLTPVTNAMYARFVNAGGYKNPDLWTDAGWAWVRKNRTTAPKDYDGFTVPVQPRVGVTWFEAYAYCRWRDGRLPTEAEWEWAARGPENRTYPWGNEFDAQRVVYGENSGDKTAPVNANTRIEGASWVGALDMSGNVWEWTNSLFWPYPYDSEDGRESLDDGENLRVLRGGSWGDIEFGLQAAPRYRDLPSSELNFSSFRCACPS